MTGADMNMREWIDNASYESLLWKWRFAEAGSPFFQGEMGEYYGRMLQQRRDEVGADAHVAASKRIGWDKP